jgi:hypothetical protein
MAGTLSLDARSAETTGQAKGSLPRTPQLPTIHLDEPWLRRMSLNAREHLVLPP